MTLREKEITVGELYRMITQYSLAGMHDFRDYIIRKIHAFQREHYAVLNTTQARDLKLDSAYIYIYNTTL